MRLRLLLAAPVFLLLAGCDLDDLMGIKKPAPGSKELAGVWNCNSTAAKDQAGVLPAQSQLAVMRDGMATEMAVVRAAVEGKQLETHSVAKMSWVKRNGELNFKIIHYAVTQYSLDGMNVDLGEANKAVRIMFDRQPERKLHNTTIVNLTADKLVVDNDNGARLSCARKV